MNDNLQPLGNDPLEARITAWVLGEASPFEAAELEALCEKDPELKLFLHRTTALHALIKDAETTSNTPSDDWKLPAGKKIKLARLLDDQPEIPALPIPKRDLRRLTIISAFAIAACITFAAFLVALMSPDFYRQHIALLTEGRRQSAPTTEQSRKELTAADIHELKKAIRIQEDRVEENRRALQTISRTKKLVYWDKNEPGNQPERDKELEKRRGLVKADALEKSIDTQDYFDATRKHETDLAVLEQMKLKLLSAEIEKNISDTEAKPAAPTSSMSKAIAANAPDPTSIPVPEIAVAEPTLDFGEGKDFGGGWDDEGLRSGEVAMNRNSIDAILNNPDRLNDASIARAQELIKVGKYNEARELLKQAETNAPDDARIKEEIANLADPLVTSPALTYEHTKQVDDVRRNLYMAQGNYDLGKYDAAKKSYEDILRIDPYNTAARRGMEKIAAAKSDYYRAAYDHTRAELMMQVDKAWELSVPADEGEKDTDLFGDNLESNFEGLANTEKLELPHLPETGKSGYAWWGGDEATKTSDFDGFQYYGASIAGEPTGVKINTKFVEVTQANDEELGFDWVHSPSKDASVVSRSGADSSFNVIREFIYPTEFEAPELPVTDPVTPAFPALVDESDADLAPILGDIPVIGQLFKEKPIDLADLAEEIPATQEPFSTFSLNISDASFQLALAAVEKGERPDPASIKPEQFYNAVDYGDPAPSTQEPVAAAIDQTAHPVIPGRNLVRVAIRTASTGRSAAQPLRLTLLVDQSGSMARDDRRAALDAALAQLATLLTENDRITVIGFSRTPRLIADSLPGNEASKLPNLINTTASEGGTNLQQALHLASELALRHHLKGAQNRIVLFTDGAANLGDADPEILSERIKELRQQNLAFDIAGIGTNDTNDRLLSELARHGDGRYYLVDENTGETLATQLAGAFRPAAENVKIQVKLNPERVGNYKLIGFEKDRLKTEDFRNDSVDAAELAADEAGVAIYQVETLPEGTGEIGEVSVRFRDTASGEMVERSWTIPHDPSTPAFDKADPKTQLATLALLAAQKLQGGPMADAIHFNDHAQTIAKLKQTYAHDPKAQRLFTLINALK